MLTSGDVFAGYRIEGLIGEGGMGAVYLARHPRLPRQDALKILHPALSRQPAYVVRFEREADVASRLSHPSIVAVYDRGMTDGQLWISMQYVRGRNAAEELRAHGPFSPDRTRAVIAAVADALDHAHANGLVHRDVKPDNILLAQRTTGTERVMLTDFGIAAVSGGEGPTTTGSFVATMAYAPLEQLQGQGVDPRTDVYALGAVLFELLTGQRPFGGVGVEAVYAAKLRGEIPDPAAHRPGLPPGVGAVLRRAMAADPEARYRSCGELAAAADRALGHVPAPSPPPPAPEPPTRGRPRPASPSPPPSPPTWPPYEPPRGRRRGLLVAWVLGLVLLLAGAATATLLLTSEPEAPSGLAAEPTPDGVVLRWDPVAGADRYQVLRGDDSIASTSETTFTDAGAEGGRTYRYSVVTVDATGERSEAAAFDEVTAVLAIPEVDEPAVDGLSVTLSWAPVPGAEHYEVDRNGVTVAGNLTATTFVDAHAEAGRHTYSVTAVDDDGEGGQSSVDVRVDLAPWGTMQPIASALPGLFPSTPEESLSSPIGPHSCAPAQPDGPSTAVERVICTFDNGLSVVVDRFATAEEVTAELTAFVGDHHVPWNCGGRDQGRFGEGTTTDGRPFELLTFFAPELKTFNLYAVWTSDRTEADLRATFFESDAPCP